MLYGSPWLILYFELQVVSQVVYFLFIRKIYRVGNEIYFDMIRKIFHRGTTFVIWR